MNSRWRAAGIVPAIALILTAWLHWHEPGHAAGLLAALALTVILSPPAVLMAPAWPAVLVPRRRRAIWRGRRARPEPDTPEWLRRAVLAADRGQCVFCGSRTRLHVDHITPWAGGGLTTMYNLAVLCRAHNEIKSNFSVDPDGYVHYRPFDGLADPVMAAAILAKERRRRLHPGRWLRAVRSLGSSPGAGTGPPRQPRRSPRPAGRDAADRRRRPGPGRTWRPGDGSRRSAGPPGGHRRPAGPW